MKLYSRDSIARDVEFQIFQGKTVWSLLFRASEGLRFVTGAQPSNSELFTKLTNNITAKLRPFGASLKEILVVSPEGLIKVDYKNCQEHMDRIVREDTTVIFRVNIKNKNYDFQVK